MQKSALFSWNLRDLIHGTIMTVGAAVIPLITESMSAKAWTFNWPDIWHTGAAAGFVYLSKQFLTGPPDAKQ